LPKLIIAAQHDQAHILVILYGDSTTPERATRFDHMVICKIAKSLVRASRVVAALGCS
jgi:hypothetical protein